MECEEELDSSGWNLGLAQEEGLLIYWKKSLCREPVECEEELDLSGWNLGLAQEERLLIYWEKSRVH